MAPMKTKADGREARGEARRRAWRDAALKLELLAHTEPPGIEGRYLALYRETARAIREFCAQRGRGVLGAPPGGVGVRR